MGTSITVSAHKIINSQNKTAEQIDPKQRDREGSCHLSIRKIPSYMQACCFQSKAGRARKPPQQNKGGQMLTAMVIDVRVDLKYEIMLL